MPNHKWKNFDDLLKGKYTQESLSTAVRAVLKGELDVTKASGKYACQREHLGDM